MDIQEQLKALIDGSDNKDQIERVGAIKESIDALEAAKTKAENDYKDLLQNYAALVKASAFKVDDEHKTAQGVGIAPQTFEDFLKDYEIKK